MADNVKIELEEADGVLGEVTVKPWTSKNRKSKPAVRITNKSDDLDIRIYFPGGSPFSQPQPTDGYSVLRNTHENFTIYAGALEDNK